MKSYRDTFTSNIRQLQDDICAALEPCDGRSAFAGQKWDREGGGGGHTRVISDGSVFEKGGVNTAEVFGTLPQTMVDYLGVEHADFFGCGLSLVLHPVNPFVPTVHANYRYFEIYAPDRTLEDCWFGGGADLTPYYLFEEDARHFHTIHKKVCDRFDPDYYDRFKKACDSYFYNHHRAEARGIGGMFFDRLRPAEDGVHWFDFVMAQGHAFLDAYLPIAERRKDMKFTNDQKWWQEVRRGRYVEFNLIHDKGTLFGLKTDGRIESILMSLPPTVRWVYDYAPPAGSEESRLLTVLQKPRNWIR